MPMGAVNWESLKELSIEDCCCSCEDIRSIVSGSPLLQSLELKNCFPYRGRFVIASRSLKRLVVSCCGVVDICCPNLVEFYGSRIDFGCFDKVLEKFLSGSPLLEVLELQSFWFQNLRIASTTLKRFVFSVVVKNEMQILCPHLKELVLNASVRKMTLTDLPSSVCVSLNFPCNIPCDGTLAKQILEQLQHLNELKLGSSFIDSLSALEKDGISHPLLNCKSLTLEDTIDGQRDFDIPGIAYALRSLPLLERLVIKLQPHKVQSFARPLDFGHLEENYWNLHETHFSNLVSCLRTVEITGLSKAVLDFVEFLSKNAGALEKMVVMLEDHGTDFVTSVSRKLLSKRAGKNGCHVRRSWN